LPEIRNEESDEELDEDLLEEFAEDDRLNELTSSNVAPATQTREPAPSKPEAHVVVRRVYRGVDYEIILDVNEVESVDQVGLLMRQAERFIDKMLDAKVAPATEEASE